MAEAVSPGGAVWEGTGLTLGQIDSQLQRLWRAADSQWDGQGRRPDIRTSVLNLIVYAHNQACADRATTAIEHLSGTHPSRSIIIESGDPHRNSSIDAHLAIHSHGAYAEFRQVCSEELILKVHGPASQHLSSVLVPLLAPDLPVFVWWPGETPFHHHMYAQLRDVTGRFIVNSADFAKPAEDLVSMAGAVRSATHCTFSDFSWVRAAPWREQVTAFFDLQRFRPCLDQLRSMRIRCQKRTDGVGLDEPQALMLCGWLAASLGFQATEREIADGHYTLHMRKGDRQLDLYVDADASALADVQVSLQAPATADEPAAEFTVGIDNHGNVTATADVTASEPLVRTSRIDDRHEGQLLFLELEMFGKDTPYEQAIMATSSMLDPRHHSAQVRGSMLA